ncbi:MAG: hypothetical protein HQK49_16345 [Oligoflexia bacterium]|nr:hypothetical protein [Oligoflexia bacterium]
MNLISLFRNEILHSTARILSLLDKNPCSNTFGCLDRKYWQYKIIDFPSYMQQELILPLVYVYKNKFDGNIYYEKKAIRNFIDGVFLFHKRSIHSDGSVDDYFPYERAYGATAYTLAALTESVIILGEKISTDVLSAFEKSADFLCLYKESGLLSNHLAIAALSLANLYKITQNSSWKIKAKKLLELLLKQQSHEGWFKEYEGCDIGYQTVTLEFFLRSLTRLNMYEEMQSNVENLISFLFNMIHPDGSLGGEYCSRNTFNFYPNGFAILSSKYNNDKAQLILDGYIKSVLNGNNYFLEDDGVFSHQLASKVNMLVYSSSALKSSAPQFFTQKLNSIRVKEKDIVLQDSGFFRIFKEENTLIGSLNKGGIFKFFKNDKLLWSDTGLVLQDAKGKYFCQNNSNSSCGFVNENIIKIEGYMQKMKTKKMGIIHMMGIRLLSMIFGKFSVYSNLIRWIMQKMLIISKSSEELYFKREIILSEKLIIKDYILKESVKNILSLKRSTYCVNSHVVTSDSYQIGNLIPWEDIDLGSFNKELDLYVYTKEVER